MSEPIDHSPDTAQNTGLITQFGDQKAKWDEWLEDRKNAGNAYEHLAIFVDDEISQLHLRYYDARLLQFPGRNILLFEDAAEAAAFIRYAQEKNLNIGAVATDFDNNGRPTNGNHVLETAVEYEKANGTQMVKILLSSIERELSPALLEYNAKPTTQEQQKAVFFTKDKNHSIRNHLCDGRHEKADLKSEQTQLIPDIIHTMRIIDTVVDMHQRAIEPYLTRIPPKLDPVTKVMLWQDDGHGGKTTVKGKRTLAEHYPESIKLVNKNERRVEDMLKIWALIKHYENKSGMDIPNPDSYEPEEPVNVRILGAFFLEEFKRINDELQRCQDKEDWFNFTQIRNTIEQDKELSPDPEVRKEIASRTVHNIRGPLNTLRAQVAASISRIEEFLQNQPRGLITEPGSDNQHRFDHMKLLEATHDYRVESREGVERSFYYLPFSTGDRSRKTPGVRAPARETLVIPHSDKEKMLAEHMQPVSGIQPGVLERLEKCIFADYKISKAMTTATQQELSMALLKYMAEHRSDAGKPSAGSKK